jgi:hypothetical protein
MSKLTDIEKAIAECEREIRESDREVREMFDNIYVRKLAWREFWGFVDVADYFEVTGILTHF